MMKKTTNSEDRLQQIIEIERQLGEIQDVDVLLERILTETRRIVNADAGSIYVVEVTGSVLNMARMIRILESFLLE